MYSFIHLYWLFSLTFKMTWALSKSKEMGGNSDKLGALFFISQSWSANLPHGTEEAHVAQFSHPKAHKDVNNYCFI